MAVSKRVEGRPTILGRDPGGPPVPWSWADERLRAARNYWVVTVGPSRRPHARPYWGCWSAPAFLFSTSSRALRNAGANPQVSLHLESGSDVVVAEGRASVVRDSEDLRSFVEEYNRKYDWNLEVRGELVCDDQGASGNVVAVHASVVYAWHGTVETATRWRFEAGTPGPAAVTPGGSSH